MGIGFLWALMGRGVYMLGQWLMLILIARHGSAELVGSFGLALSIATPFFVLTFVCMPVLTASRYKTYPAGVFLSAAQVGLVLAMVGAVLLAIGVGREGDALLIFLGVALIKGLESYSDVLYGIFRRKGKLARMGQSQVLKGALGAAIFAVIVWMTGAPSVALFGFFAGALVIYLLFDRPQVRAEIGRVGGPWGASVSWYRQIVRSAFPLSIMTLLTALASAAPRYFIEAWEGREALGYFVVVSYFLMAMTTFGYVFSQAANPRLANAWRNKKSTFWSLVFRYSVVVVAVCVSAWFFLYFTGSFFLRSVFGEEYSSHVSLLLILFAASIPLTLRDLFSTALVVVGEVKAQANVSLIGMAIVCVCCYLLLPSYGVHGVAVSILAAAIVTTTILSWRLWLRCRNPIYSSV